MDLFTMMISIIAIISTSAFGGLLITYLNIAHQNKKLKASNEEFERQNIALSVELENEQEKNTNAKKEHQEALKEQAKSYERQYNELNAKLNESFKESLKSAKAELLNLNTTAINQSSNELVNKALQSEIKPLRDAIEKYTSENLKLTTTFRENFEGLRLMSGELSKQANELASALKGNKKATGNWGEAQLDLVLEQSGLEEHLSYEKQVCYKDENGDNRFLDVVVNFGDKKKAIIDAKCSLINYVKCVNSDEAAANEARKALAKDIKNHIDLLSAKEYHKFKGAFDYVFMFIPNENMLSMALLADENLYQYASSKGIFLTTPFTLFIALRTVHLCWQNLKIEKNTARIFDIASGIYDKVATFSLDFDTFGRKIDEINKLYAALKNHLRDGKGNIEKRVNDLKFLGAKTTKNLKDFNEEDDYYVDTTPKISKKIALEKDLELVSSLSQRIQSSNNKNLEFLRGPILR